MHPMIAKIFSSPRARLPYWAICLRLWPLAHFVCAAKGVERKEAARGIQEKYLVLYSHRQSIRCLAFSDLLTVVFHFQIPKT